MSMYSGFKIETNFISLNNEIIKKLELFLQESCFLSRFEDIENIINKDYLKYNIAFNHNLNKVIDVLKLIESNIVELDKVYKIGNFCSENYINNSDMDIYSYNGKFYIIGFDCKYVTWFVEEKRYRISDLDLNFKNIDFENEDPTIKEIIKKYINNKAVIITT